MASIGGTVMIVAGPSLLSSTWPLVSDGDRMI